MPLETSFCQLCVAVADSKTSDSSQPVRYVKESHANLEQFSPFSCFAGCFLLVNMTKTLGTGAQNHPQRLNHKSSMNLHHVLLLLYAFVGFHFRSDFPLGPAPNLRESFKSNIPSRVVSKVYIKPSRFQLPTTNLQPHKLLKHGNLSLRPL